MMKIRTFVGFVTDVVRRFYSHHVPRAAAALTYYFVLSIFPLLVCINACVGMFHVDIKVLLDSLSRLLPEQVIELVGGYVESLSQSGSVALVSAGVIAVLTTASAGVRVLLVSMNEFWGHRREISMRRMVISVLFSVLLLVALYLSMVVVFAGKWLFGFVHHLLPEDIASRVSFTRIAGLWLNLRYVLLFCVILVLVLILYRFGMPREKVGTRYVLLCALLSAVALVIASAIFSAFIGISTRYSLLYGSLASIIILLLWLYLCGVILLLGVLIGRVWMDWRPTPKKKETR